MPEGPSLRILQESTAGFAGKKILRVEGNAGIDLQRLKNRRIVSVRSWGKHFLIELQAFSVRIHLLMFGSYRINERKEGAAVRLGLG
ncbi:MAG: endonuclease, partial [Burkholderiales bacterium]